MFNSVTVKSINIQIGCRQHSSLHTTHQPPAPGERLQRLVLVLRLHVPLVHQRVTDEGDVHPHVHRHRHVVLGPHVQTFRPHFGRVFYRRVREVGDESADVNLVDRLSRLRGGRAETSRF